MLNEKLNGKLVGLLVGEKHQQGRNIDSLYEAMVNEQASALTKQIESNLNLSVQVYPNPASNYIDVSSENSLTGVFVLYDALGSKILEEDVRIEHGKQTIKLINVSTGIYHYEIKSGEKQKAVGRLSIIN